MSKDVTFQLDLKGGGDVLQNMVSSHIAKSGNAIAKRANSLASEMSSNPPSISSNTAVGVIRRGKRAIATVEGGGSERQNYIAHEAIKKSIDAGRL